MFNFFSPYKKKLYKNNKIHLRKKTVDAEVYDYVFIEKYHRPFKSIESKKPVILDLGSNIGLTVVDIKDLYPGSEIFAFEMDSENYDLSLLNCKNLRGVHLFNKAVWYKEMLLQYEKGSSNDAYKIEEGVTKNNAVEVEAISIKEIISANGIKYTDYVKMDIEGAEYEIFQNDLEWLKITSQIKIEVHYGEDVFDFIGHRKTHRVQLGM